MTKTRSTKRALVLSALSLLVCVSMLVGSTFAWFTDSVSSGNNIIKSGNLDVTMEWKDATATGAQQAYKDASEGAIFNYDLWEPGYVEAKNIKIGNAGTLALKYQLSIAATGTVSKLADVIDVYYAEGELTLASREMTELTRLGTLTEVLANISTTASGNLKATENHTITLALKMQESAGNEYQNLAIGSKFAVQVLATQLTSEFDSFDNQYDKEASFDDAILDFGGVINLDGNVNKEMTVAEGAEVIINTNDYTINNTLTNNGDVTVNGGVIASSGSNALYNEGTAELKDVDLNMTDNSGYITNSRTADSVTIYENVTATSSGGGVNVWEGEALFKSGTITTNSISTSPRHMFYVADGAKLTIEDGEFFFNPSNLTRKGSYICADAGATVIVNGGTFHKASTRTDPIQALNGSTVTIYGGTFAWDPSAWVADGYTAIKNGEYYVVVPGENGAVASDNASFDSAIAGGADTVLLNDGDYVVPGAVSGKNVTIIGNGNTVIDITTVATYAGLPGATLTFENLTIKSDPQGAGYNRGFAHTNKVTYNNCVINGTLGLNTGDTEFNDCTFNISGDYYSLWTWGADNVTLNNCTFNSDGKALLLYGTANTKLTVNGCTFNDNGGLADLKAAIEIGNDYNKSYELIVNNTTVNGYEINDKGINTGTTLWGNKNSMGTDKLNVVVDGVDVY